MANDPGADSAAMRPTLDRRWFPIGVGLASFATVALELLLTRIYSVTMYYHFAFMIISLALLGLAVAGVLLYLFPRFFARRSAATWGALGMLAFAAGVVFALKISLANPINLHSWRASWPVLIGVYLAAAIPFLASGFALSTAIAAAGPQIGRIYAFDLVGASLGCLAVVPLLPILGGPGALVGVAAVGALAAAVLAFADRARSRGLLGVAVLLAVGLGGVAAREPRAHWFGAARNPEKFLGNRPVLFEKWNAFSQITVAPASESDHRWLFIDADAATRMWSGEVARHALQVPRRFPEVRVASLVYALRHDGKALIIGPGGGTDVISALAHGVPAVFAVEVNPIIVDDVVRGRFAPWNGDLYRDPRVHVEIDEGRSYIRRSPDAFASIQATLVDTWAASSSGAFTLSENNIYTVEAFSEFLDHLVPGGILTVTRWYNAGAPKEFLRLVALGREALERRGVSPPDVARHFAVATDNDRRGTLLVSRDPFSAQDLATLRAQVIADGARLLYSPAGTAGGGGAGEDALLHSFLEAPSTASAASVLARLRYDASPTVDDRPFFFYSLRRAQLWSVFGNLGALELNNLGIAILLLLLLMSVVMTLLLVVAPLLLLKREALRRDRGTKLRLLGYFLSLGLGYILVEVGFMQKFVLFLGHPLYALAVVLASLLAASGTGSGLSGWGIARWGLRPFAARTAIALAALLVVYALALTPLFHALLGLPLPARVAITILLVAPAGTLMGTLLPTGVRVANTVDGDRDGRSGAMVAWSWSANGAASVVGSVVAMFLSMNFGFTLALLAGVAVYLGAAGLLPAKRPHSHTP